MERIQGARGAVLGGTEIAVCRSLVCTTGGPAGASLDHAWHVSPLHR